MSMYIRLKRKAQTVFLHVENSDSFASIKQRIAALFSMEAQQISLIGSDKKKEMADLATVSDQGIQHKPLMHRFFLLSPLNNISARRSEE